MTSIRVEDLWKRYGAVEAVKGLTLTCADGELLALLGPSGCGKTSTLKMLAGIEDVSQGRVYFGDRPVTRLAPAERNVAMVFEDYALYPHLSVAQNIAFPLDVRRRPRVETEAAVRGVLTLLGLEALRDVAVKQLSGGAQQRVAIGRALVREPTVILFDEPLSHLDGAHKLQLRAEIKRLQKTTGVTGVLVTHDQTEAMAMADRVAVMHLGVLQQLGAPQELYDHPANLFVAQFIGEPPMNVLTGELRSHGGSLVVEGSGWSLILPERAAHRLASTAHRQLAVGIRSEDLELVAGEHAGRRDGAAAGQIPGTVFFRELRGETDIVLVTPGFGPQEPGEPESRRVMAVEVQTEAGFKEGDAVRVLLPAEAYHLFDANSGLNVLGPPRGIAA